MKAILCAKRHDTPDDAMPSIFPTQITTFDPYNLEGQACEWLKANGDPDHLDLYVTGFTVALIAVVNACALRDIDLTLWHYRRSEEMYYGQHIYRRP